MLKILKLFDQFKKRGQILSMHINLKFVGIPDRNFFNSILDLLFQGLHPASGFNLLKMITFIHTGIKYA